MQVKNDDRSEELTLPAYTRTNVPTPISEVHAQIYINRTGQKRTGEGDHSAAGR